jgi:hypothetical protein
MFPSFFPNFLLVMWYIQKTIAKNKELNIIAIAAPKKSAKYIHQVVYRLKKKKKIYA